MPTVSTSIRPKYYPTSTSVFSEDSDVRLSPSDTTRLNGDNTIVLNDNRLKIVREQIKSLKELQDPIVERNRIQDELIRICADIHNGKIKRFDIIRDVVKTHRDSLLEIYKQLGLANVVNKLVDTKDELLKQSFKLLDFCNDVINKKILTPLQSLSPIEWKIATYYGQDSKISRTIKILEAILDEPPISDSHKHLLANLPLAAVKNRETGKFERWFFLGKGQEIDSVTNRVNNGFFFMKPRSINGKDAVEYKFVKEEKLAERPLLLRRDKFEELTSESTNPDLSHLREISINYNNANLKCRVIGRTNEISKNQTYVGKYVLIHENDNGTIQILQNVDSSLAKPKTKAITSPTNNNPTTLKSNARTTSSTAHVRPARISAATKYLPSPSIIGSIFNSIGRTLTSWASTIFGIFKSAV